MKKILAIAVLSLGFLFTAQSTQAQQRYEYRCEYVRDYYGRVVRQCQYYPVYRNYGQWRRENNPNQRYHRDDNRRYDDRRYDRNHWRYDSRRRIWIRINL